MYQNVNVYVKAPTGAPWEGVVVRVLDPVTYRTLTDAVTDVNGLAPLVLFGSQSYELRFYRDGLRTPRPALLVLEETGVEVTYRLEPIPEPYLPEPDKCLVRAQFRKVDGTPYTKAPVVFDMETTGAIYNKDLALFQTLETRTDEYGRVDVPLYRGACMRVRLAHLDEETYSFKVPDKSVANLFDLVFAYITSISYYPSPPTALAVGEVVNIGFIPVRSDDLPVTNDQDYVAFSSEDSTVLEVSAAGGVLTLRGVSPGTAEVRVVRTREPRIARFPEPLPLVVTTVTVS